MRILSFIIIPLMLADCSSVTITPRSIAAMPTRERECDNARVALHEAVVIANAFLHSDYRKTLPAGDLVLREDGMSFVTSGTEFPVRIECSFAGDILIPFHYAAQERSWGFVVGLVPPRQSRVIDNTLFKDSTGKPLLNFQVSHMILHELTHSYLKSGTVSVWKTVMYYAECVFLFRYKNHSMERLAFQTDREFEAYVSECLKRQAALQHGAVRKNPRPPR